MTTETQEAGHEELSMTTAQHPDESTVGFQPWQATIISGVTVWRDQSDKAR